MKNQYGNSKIESYDVVFFDEIQLKKIKTMHCVCNGDMDGELRMIVLTYVFDIMEEYPCECYTIKQYATDTNRYRIRVKSNTDVSVMIDNINFEV